VLVGAGVMLVNQCAISAVLVATIQPPASGMAGTRFLDAVIGCAFALLVNAVVPTNPIRLVRREAEPLLEELADVLGDVADALEERDVALAQAALERGRAIDPSTARFREALDDGRDSTLLSPSRRGTRGHLALYAGAFSQIDHAIRNTRVLARGAIRAVELDEHVPPLAIAAVRELGASVRALSDELAGQHGSSASSDAALRAAASATAALEETANLSASVIVGQVRSTAVDLLRGMGVEADEARTAVREARANLGI
jgi:hypothetical protein